MGINLSFFIKKKIYCHSKTSLYICIIKQDKQSIMKNIVRLLVIAFLINVSLVSAKELGPKKTYTQTTEQLSIILNAASGRVYNVDDQDTVEVKITVNGQHQIKVLETYTDNKEIIAFIEKSLNKAVLRNNELKPNESYVFEVKFNL